MKQQLNIWSAKPENIWNYRQNHPELVIKDIQNSNTLKTISETLENEGIIQKGFLMNTIIDLVRQSMLCRGINKWLKVRRDLIAYKIGIKHEVKELMNEVIILKKQLTDSFVEIDFTKDISVEDFLKYDQYKNNQTNYLKAKELLKYKTKIRGDLKALCMTERWQIWKDKKLNEMNKIKFSDQPKIKKPWQEENQVI